MACLEQRWPGTLSSVLLAGLTTSLLSAAAYLPTVAPGISWRNGGADSGELAAAVMSLGIPHPPGYPTYVLLGSLWTALPFGGDVAYRLNLFSAASAAVAAGLGAMTVSLLGARAGVAPGMAAIGGGLGGLAFALAPLTWSQATIAEVYAPGLAVVGAVSLLLLMEQADSSVRLRVLTGLLGGLGLGLLPQIALLGPGAALLLGLQYGWRHAARMLTQMAYGLALGVSIFSFVPWRAASDPFINWGNPSTAASLWAQVSAASYRPMLGAMDWGQWIARVAESIVALGDGLGWVWVVLAVAGAYTAGLRVAGAYFGGVIVTAVAFRAAYPADGNVVYLLPALYGLAVLAGLGMARLLSLVVQRRGDWAAIIVAVGCATLIVVRAPVTAADVDVSRDIEADAFGRRVMASVPPNALVVSEHDETTFALWYRQALGERPDVVVVDGRLLTHGWFRAQLARRYADLPPAAVRPGGLTAVGRPVFALVGEPAEATLQPVARPSAAHTSGISPANQHAAPCRVVGSSPTCVPGISAQEESR